MALINLSDIESKFEFHNQNGFLPAVDPLRKLSPNRTNDCWQLIGEELPKLLATTRTRETILDLPDFNVDALKTPAELERAMLLFSYLGHAYVWCGDPTPQSLPAKLAVPWHAVSNKLGRPPVLSYPTYALHNWRRFDPNAPIALGNIALIQNFMGGIDEEWFIIVHVHIEALAAPGILSILQMQDAIRQSQFDLVIPALEEMAKTLEAMHVSMLRMTEFCDPYIYFNRVRPYIHGWKNHPKIPNGIIYEGVSEYNNMPKQFRGETGAQSGIVPCFDAGLGIKHKNDMLLQYLLEMRNYMSPKHRSLLETIESAPSIREFLSSNRSSNAKGISFYNDCIHWLEAFRSIHLTYAKDYIEKQHQISANNPSKVGTGGTPFVNYLEKHRKETEDHKL